MTRLFFPIVLQLSFCFVFSSQINSPTEIILCLSLQSWAKMKFLSFCCHTAVTQQIHFPITFATTLTLFSSFDELYLFTSALSWRVGSLFLLPAYIIILTSNKRAHLAADVNLPWQSLFLRCIQCKIMAFLLTHDVWNHFIRRCFGLFLKVQETSLTEQCPNLMFKS